MRKYLALILAILLVASFTACTQKSPISEKGTSETTTTETEMTSEAKEEFVPTKDITFVVPFDAGGTADIPARIVAKYMSKYSAKPVTVINIVGAGGSIGAREVMKAEPDGHTILHIPAGFPMQYAMGTIDFTYEDFEPVCIWLDSYLSLVVKADSEYKTFEDLVNAAKASPGTIKMGAVTGTLPLFAELKIEQHENVDFNIVDLGAGAKAPELLSGRVDAYVDGFGAVKQFVDSEQFRCLSVFADKRMTGYDNIPTFKEKGYTNIDFLNQSFGMWAPKGTTSEAIAYIESLVKKASEDPECIAELQKLSYGARYTSSSDYLPILKDVYAAFQDFAKIVKDTQ